MKNKKNNTLLKVFTILLISLFFITACGNSNGDSTESNGSEDNSQTELTFWNGFTASDGEILQEIVDEFNQTNDKGINIKMEVMTWANFNERLPTSITAGSGPDFVLMNNVDFAQYVNNGAVKPLDDFWKYDGVDQDNFEETALELGQIDGTQYFIPMQVQGMFTYWNKDLYESAGLNPEKAPETWEEVAENALQIADPSTNTHGFTINHDGNAILYNWIIQNGGQILNEDETESALASAETLEVLEKIQETIHENKSGPEYISGAELDNLLMSGQIAMHINGPWLNNGLIANEINYGVTTVPQVNPDSPFAILDGVGFGIPSSTDDNKTEAIYEFISYWNTTEIGKKWSIENGFPTYLKSVKEDSEIQNNEIVSELTKQLDFAEPLYPGNINMPTINADIIEPMLENLLTGGDPEELMNQADQEINDLVNK